METDFIIAKNTSEFSKRKRRCNTYSLIDWMIYDLCNNTFMFYVMCIFCLVNIVCKIGMPCMIFLFYSYASPIYTT